MLIYVAKLQNWNIDNEKSPKAYINFRNLR